MPPRDVNTCYDMLENLLTDIHCAKEDSRSKMDVIQSTESQLYLIIASLMSHPLCQNMSLPFTRVRETT
eukprot:2578985-Rhodomonas_salina.2